MTEQELETLHARLGHYSRMLLDLQKSRIGMGNRVDAMERDGFNPEHMAEAELAEASLEQIEAKINNALAKLAKQHFMADWILAQRGIGLSGFARLLGITGSLDRFPTVSKLWKYLGLHVTPDGTAPKKVKGQGWTHTNCQGGHLRACPDTCKTDHHPNCTVDGIGTAYAAQGRVLCYQLGESIVKVGGDGPYRAAYDRKKAEYLARQTRTGPSGCPMGQTHKTVSGKIIACVKMGEGGETSVHLHKAAMRYAVKSLVKELWIEWMHRRTEMRLAA